MVIYSWSGRREYVNGSALALIIPNAFLGRRVDPWPPELLVWPVLLLVVLRFRRPKRCWHSWPPQGYPRSRSAELIGPATRY